jgi:hypothetical protein
MKLGEPLAFRSQLVNHWRSNVSTVAAEVGVTQVIGDNQKDVGSSIALGSCGESDHECKEDQKEPATHCRM